MGEGLLFVWGVWTLVLSVAAVLAWGGVVVVFILIYWLVTLVICTSFFNRASKKVFT